MTPGRHRTLRMLLAPAAVAATLALAGCSGDDAAEGNGSREAAPDPLATAAAKTLEAGTALVSSEATFQSTEGSYALTAEGEVDYGSHRSRLVYDVSQLPGEDAAGGDVEVRLDGQTTYVRFAEGSQDVTLPEGKEWVRLGPPAPAGGDESEGQEGEEGESPAPGLEVGGVQQDPTQFLRYLQSGAAEIREEGMEDVRGAETTTYTALIDLDRVLEDGVEELGQDEEQRSAARRTAEALREQLGGSTIPVTVNVDGEGRVRRLLLSFELAPVGGGQPVSALLTTEYHDFGTEVDVDPPPEEQVIDAADVE